MAFLLILELVVRLFVIRLPYQRDVPYLGYVPVDNSTAIWGIEGYGTTHYLSNGEIATPDQTGTPVVILGDSFTEALQVNNKEKYVSVAETILHQRGIQADLHNLGASGRSLADYVYIAPAIKELYSPQIVVIQLTASDFEESFNSARPNYFVYDGPALKFKHNDKYFRFDLSFQNMLRSSGIGSLLIYKLTPLVKDLRLKLATRVKDMDKKPLPAESVEEVRASQATGIQKVKHRLSAETGPRNRDWDRDVEASIALLESAYPDSQVVFLVIPATPVLEDGSVTWGSEVDDNIVADIHKLSGLDVIYPKNAFLSLYTLDREFPRGFFNTLPGTGHLNVQGNFTVGVALADYIEGVMK